MFLRTLLLGILTLTTSLTVCAADYRPLSADDRAATDDAFAVSMYDPEFVIASKAGKANEMKAILISNGAPADMELTAQGISVESTTSDPEPSQYLNNNGICVRWRLITWYVSISTPGHPAGWYSMWACTKFIANIGGDATYDVPL